MAYIYVCVCVLKYVHIYNIAIYTYIAYAYIYICVCIYPNMYIYICMYIQNIAIYIHDFNKIMSIDTNARLSGYKYEYLSHRFKSASV